MDKIITTVVLTTMCGIVVVICRKPLSFMDDELVIKKVHILLAMVYGLAISFIFFTNYFSGKAPSLLAYFFMMTFSIIISYPMQILKYYKYEGPINLLIVAMNLTTMGLIFFYRLGLVITTGALAKITHLSVVPVALSYLIYSIFALAMLTFLLASQKLPVFFNWVERSSRLWMWGSASLILIMLPFFLGVKTGQSNLGLMKSSMQTADFVFKIFYVISIAKVLSVQEHLLRLDVVSPLKRLKAIVYMSLYSGLCFIAPLILFQKELGTPLLMYCFFLLMLTLTSRRWFIFPAGIVGISSIIGIAMVISHHVQARIIGSWLNWREWAFKAYEGTEAWAGWQPFQALTGIRAANIWGTGIMAGHPRIYSITNDFVAVGVCEEWGVLGLVILVFSFLYFIWVGFRHFLAPDFTGLTILGLAVVLFLQGFFNLSGTLMMLPITGTPLPFVSNSGVCILVSYLVVAMMMFLQQPRERSY